MGIDHLVHDDYERARRKAFWNRIRSWLTGRKNELLRFDEVREQLHVRVEHYSGLRTVPIDHIVGSVGRYRDFDRAFLPSQSYTRGRWLSVDRAHHREIRLPPVELYKLGETYFVKDGNHRISVAREHGQEFIDAYVIEVQAPAPITSLEDLEEWIRRQDALEFYERTQLAQLRPGARIELTLPGQYEKLLRHIDDHRWYLGIEQKREIPYSEAVASWYDHVYSPIVEIIRSEDILREFPGRTEADLYLWVIEHRWFLMQEGALDEDEPLDVVVRQYAEAFSERPIKRLRRAMRRRARRLARRRKRAEGETPDSSPG